MTDRYGPWIDWHGRAARSPIAAGIRHEVRFRDGTTAHDDNAETWVWKHRKSGRHPGDIVAYRIIK